MSAAGGDLAGAQAAMATLCQAYWYPLYAFARRQGICAAGWVVLLVAARSVFLFT